MDSETTGCCNGTLSYVWHHAIFPCSNMTCCNTSETVAVVHVNHALGFCFRCVPKTEFSGKECFTEGKEVVTSNNETLDYRPRTCCEGAKFKVHLNSEDTALIIRCIKR
ncbi:hypothetical protein ACJMK2_028188 [Sinanodonta woodiana]|uniref:Uncharacterized protein n=1 Tax=Sinanodonta woodiana TaxID=1069815 RepID=A0ABD3X6C7_SINWO